MRTQGQCDLATVTSPAQVEGLFGQARVLLHEFLQKLVEVGGCLFG